MSIEEHKSEALRLTVVASESNSVAAATVAVAEATIYLAEQQAAAAEQQRVANLLAAAKLILDSKNVKYGVLGVADWATDSDADVHEALATSSVWIALLGYDKAKRKGMTA